MNKTIFTEDFLLHTEQAKKLYHNYAEDLPVIDYHNHLPPDEIAENKRFETITEIWLKGDHYKWRAMRALAISEQFITGNASDEEKFYAWAKCVPQTLRNPLFHWTHLELKNPFGIHKYLDERSAESIYRRANEKLQAEAFRTKALLQHFKVEMACTTDDPVSDLQYHRQIAADNFSVKVVPGFRPDKVFNIANKAMFMNYLCVLSETAGMPITDYDSLLDVLQQRINYFHEAGCRIADHGLHAMPAKVHMHASLREEFKNYLQDKHATHFSDAESFQGALLTELCRMYHAKGWVQQFHLGPLRNNSIRQFEKLGPDTGFDSIGDEQQAHGLSVCLSELDRTGELAKTVIYNINPSFNEVFAAMAGNFNDGTVRGKVQFGSGWWFLDQMDGMTKQLNALSSIGLLSTFVGMLTDSRSFLSFTRHEYFRRLLCNILGEEMNKGLLPDDEAWIGEVVKNVCYYNAKNYFTF